MKRRYHLCVIISFVLTLNCFSFAQAPEEGLLQDVSIKPGLGFEYFSRTISWDEDNSSKLKSYFFTFNVEFEIKEGFSLSAILGYSLSNFDSLIFRQLPFSVELGVGDIKGFILGTELRKSLFHIRNIEIEGLGQFLYYLGIKEEWEIPGLAVGGTVEGKPSWMRASIGPVFTYRGCDYFYPYLYVNFNKLWGTFKMDQEVKDLKGSEDQKITGKSVFSASLGAIYELSDAFNIKGEVSLMPFKDGVDLGIMFRAMYSF